jgi:hypothetical protein
MDDRRQLLEEAGRLITGDRTATHGNYSQEAARIGKAWAAILRLPDDIPPHVVAACMLALKACRATSGRPNRDDWVDAAGYAANGWQTVLDAQGGSNGPAV